MWICSVLAARVGTRQERFRDRDPSFGEALVEVHGSLRVWETPILRLKSSP